MQFIHAAISKSVALFWWKRWTRLSYVSWLLTKWTSLTLACWPFSVMTITFSQVNVLFSFDGDAFVSIGSSKYSHIWTRGLANYKGQALTTGCNSFDECSFKTELLNMTTLRVGSKRFFERFFSFSSFSTSILYLEQINMQYLHFNYSLRIYLRWSEADDFLKDDTGIDRDQ